MADQNPYAATGTPGKDVALGKPTMLRRMVVAFLLAACVSLAMYLSLTAKFSGGLSDAISGGSVLSGGIVTYARGGVLHLPFINFAGALVFVFVSPLATNGQDQPPVAWQFFVTSGIAYYAMTFVNEQRLVKKALLSGQAPFVTAETLVAPLLAWLTAFLLMFATVKLLNRAKA